MGGLVGGGKRSLLFQSRLAPETGVEDEESKTLGTNK